MKMTSRFAEELRVQLNAEHDSAVLNFAKRRQEVEAAMEDVMEAIPLCCMCSHDFCSTHSMVCNARNRWRTDRRYLPVKHLNQNSSDIKTDNGEKTGEESIGVYETLHEVIGDQATCKNIRGVRRFRQDDVDDLEKLTWAKSCSGDFHTGLPVINKEHRIAHLKDVARSSTRWTSSSTMPVNQMDEFLHHACEPDGRVPPPCLLTNSKTSKQLRPLAECIGIAPTTLAPGNASCSALFSPLAAADLQDVATASKGPCSGKLSSALRMHATALSVFFSCRYTLPVGASNTPPTGRAPVLHKRLMTPTHFGSTTARSAISQAMFNSMLHRWTSSSTMPVNQMDEFLHHACEGHLIATLLQHLEMESPTEWKCMTIRRLQSKGRRNSMAPYKGKTHENQPLEENNGNPKVGFSDEAVADYQKHADAFFCHLYGGTELTPYMVKMIDVVPLLLPKLPCRSMMRFSTEGKELTSKITIRKIQFRKTTRHPTCARYDPRAEQHRQLDPEQIATLQDKLKRKSSQEVHSNKEGHRAPDIVQRSRTAFVHRKTLAWGVSR
ncbi:hypothetical protein Bbelb_291680 [Branchiostoma belcheri]|nr:hypothetical protein Bbelb_291680 [Branchiostoma belcheri]